MATGKELTRLVSCNIWKNFVIPKLKWYQIFDNEGKPISNIKAEKKCFCHIKILLQGVNEEYLNLLAEFLKVVASTRSESMNSNINCYYSFQEIIIS